MLWTVGKEAEPLLRPRAALVVVVAVGPLDRARPLLLSVGAAGLRARTPVAPRADDAHRRARWEPACG